MMIVKKHHRHFQKSSEKAENKVIFDKKWIWLEEPNQRGNNVYLIYWQTDMPKYKLWDFNFQIHLTSSAHIRKSQSA